MSFVVFKVPGNFHCTCRHKCSFLTLFALNGTEPGKSHCNHLFNQASFYREIFAGQAGKWVTKGLQTWSKFTVFRHILESQAHLLCILQTDRLSRRQFSIYLSQNTQILSNFYRLQNVSRWIKVQHLVEAVVLLYLLNICCQSGALVK